MEDNTFIEEPRPSPITSWRYLTPTESCALGNLFHSHCTPAAPVPAGGSGRSDRSELVVPGTKSFAGSPCPCPCTVRKTTLQSLGMNGIAFYRYTPPLQLSLHARTQSERHFQRKGRY